MSTLLTLSRDQILGHRRRAGHLDHRLPAGGDSLRRAAWCGLQDSMPRAALLAIHARVEGTHPTSWEDPALVQVWGPRYSAFVVPTLDHALFTRSRLSDDPLARRREVDTADAIEGFLAGRRLDAREVGRGVALHPNALRYAAPTGRLLIRWDGARQPTIRTVPEPDIEPADARRELVRRYLHVAGPATPETFARWAGIPDGRASDAFHSLGGELLPARSPVGEGWIRAADRESFTASPDDPAAARLLPSGDPYTLHWGAERGLVVPHGARRERLWTPRVWPGAVMVRGEIVGTWRRASTAVVVEPWRRLAAANRAAIKAEAESLPLPDADDIRVRFDT